MKTLENYVTCQQEVLNFEKRKQASINECITFIKLQISCNNLALHLRKKNRHLPPEGQSRLNIQRLKLVLDILIKVLKHLPSLTLSVQLCTYQYIFNYSPKGLLKVAQHKLPVSSYFTYVNQTFQIVKDKNPLEARVQNLKLYNRRKSTSLNNAASTSSNVLIGHQSFGRNRTERLVAEAHDPPGVLLMSKAPSFPSVSGYKYISTKFFLETPHHKGKESCQLVLFDKFEQRNAFLQSHTPSVKKFACSVIF